MKNKRKCNISSILELEITNKIKLHIGTVILLLSAIIFNYADLFLIAYSCAFLHELGHVFAAKRMNVSVGYIKIQPFGIMAKISDNYIKNPTKELIISIAGPFVSLILFTICSIFQLYFPSEILSYATWINAGLLTINLIPCLPLDGGRVLKSMITNEYGIITAYNFMVKFSRIIMLIMAFISAALVLTCTFNFSFILILAFLMGNTASEYKVISIITMKEIIYNKQKLYKNDINKTKTAAAFETMPARFLLRKLSYNYYYIIDVVDKNQTIINTVTETQIIDGIIKYGIGVLLKDIIVN